MLYTTMTYNIWKWYNYYWVHKLYKTNVFNQQDHDTKTITHGSLIAMCIYRSRLRSPKFNIYSQIKLRTILMLSMKTWNWRSIRFQFQTLFEYAFVRSHSEIRNRYCWFVKDLVHCCKERNTWDIMYWRCHYHTCSIYSSRISWILLVTVFIYNYTHMYMQRKLHNINKCRYLNGQFTPISIKEK